MIGVDSDDKVLSWIQDRITCHIPDKKIDPELHFLVTHYQMHKCSGYCLRSKKVGKGQYIRRCKFNFPREVTSKGAINPIDPSLKSRKRVYDLPRKLEEAKINDYNPLLLYLWKANVDIQYIAESSLSLTGYVTSYVTKSETSGLQDVWADLASSGSLYNRLWRFAKNCFKSREVGLYEACDLLVGDHLNEKSASVQFVNARLPTKRSRKLKNYSELKMLDNHDPNSTDMFAPSLIDVHYPNRTNKLSTMCLYDFAKHIDWYDKDDKGAKTYRRLTKPRVVSHPVFDLNRKEQEEDYYYCLILLFTPFTDESDLLLPGESAKQAFERSKSEGLLAHHERLQKMLEASKKRREITEARKADREYPPNKDEEEEEGLQVKGKSRFEEPLNLDQDVDPLDLDKRVSMLNTDQHRVYTKITSHLLHELDHEKGACSCTDLKPMQMFVSGVGGTGKSFLIQAVREFMKAIWPNLNNVTAVAAPTGLAACNVNGVTTYQLFQLPIEHDSKTASYWQLPKETLKFLREQLKNVKVFIIDEVSMVSSLNLTYIHLRLDEIYGGDEWFGGKTILCMGDLLQLPPVNGTPVFQSVPSKILSLRIGCIGSTNIWKSTMEYDELTINERQKADSVYTDILDSVRRGFPSEKAIIQLKERVFQQPVLEMYNQLKDEGRRPICLFPTRKACADVNNDLLNTLNSEIVALHSKDVIDEGASTTKWNKKAAERLKAMNLDSNLTAGLEVVLHLAVGARVMLRRNLSTEEGLVNGAIGTVLEMSSRYVTVKFDKITEPYQVSRITSRFCVLNKFYVHREQFPLIVAYAVTIHKSQGLSLDCAIIDLSTKVFGEGMAYVALSRVRSIDGVYLTSFTPDAIMASRICVEECNRLRQQFRHDLPLYELPAKRSTKRKMTGCIAPPSKRQCTGKPSAPKRGVKRNAGTTEDQPLAKKHKTTEKKSSIQEDQSSQDDCFMVEGPQHVIVRQTFPFYPLDMAGQQQACNLLKINYHKKNVVSAGGLDIPLAAPDRSTLVDTVGDGSCMFRAMSVIITGNQRQHIAIRRAIVNYLCDNEQLFINKVWLFDMQYPNMDAYVEAKQMRRHGWGSQLELFALAHMLQRRVFTYTLHGNHWCCFCPSKVDPNVPPPMREQGLYLFHTGDHYKVVTSVVQ